MASPNSLPLPLPTRLWNRMAAQWRLPPQQKRIVELILRNACDKQIAAAMQLSPSTVRTYLGRVFQRLGVHDRLELVLLVLRRSHTMASAADDIAGDDVTDDDVRAGG